jgi:hypothetical protein
LTPERFAALDSAATAAGAVQRWSTHGQPAVLALIARLGTLDPPRGLVCSRTCRRASKEPG